MIRRLRDVIVFDAAVAVAHHLLVLAIRAAQARAAMRALSGNLPACRDNG